MSGLGLDLGISMSSASPAFDPLTITPAVLYDNASLSNLWQNSNGTTAVTADGDRVGRMSDLSGNAIHAIQATAGIRPSLNITGAIEGVEFNGVDQNFDAGILSNFIAASEFDIILGGKINSVGTDSASYQSNGAIFSEAVGGWLGISARSSGKITAGVNGSTTISDDYTLGQPVVVHFQLSGGTLRLQINSRTAVTSAAANVGTITGTCQFARQVGALFANCEVNAFFARKTVLAAADLANVKAWAADRSGATL